MKPDIIIKKKTKYICCSKKTWVSLILNDSNSSVVYTFPQSSRHNTAMYHSVNAIVLTFLYVLPFTMAQTADPYFIVFEHPRVNLLTTCTDEINHVQDHVHKAYIQDLIANTTMNVTTVNQLDPEWKNTYEFDYNQTTSTSSTRRLDHRKHREEYCRPYCRDRSTMIIGTRFCCDVCVHASCGDRRSRQLRSLNVGNVPALNVAVDAHGHRVVTGTGTNISYTGSSIGRDISQKFFATIRQHIPDTDPCKPVLLDIRFKIMSMVVG